MTSFGADPDDLFGELESGLGSAEGTAIEREDGDMSFKGVLCDRTRRITKTCK